MIGFWILQVWGGVDLRYAEVLDLLLRANRNWSTLHPFLLSQKWYFLSSELNLLRDFGMGPLLTELQTPRFRMLEVYPI